MVLDTITYKGCSIQIHHDEDAESPREWDNLGTMLAKHRNYILGDDPKADADDILAITQRKDVLWLPLYLYDHSGISMRAGSPSPNWIDSRGRFVGDSAGWDTSTVGIIYVTFDKLKKEYSTKRITKKVRDLAYSVLEGEVSTYSDYLEGNVVGFIAEGPDGEDIDSCWGFYPEHESGKRDYDYMLSEAESAIDGWLKDRQAQDEQVRQLT